MPKIRRFIIAVRWQPRGFTPFLDVLLLKLRNLEEKMLKEHSQVALKKTLPALGLQPGDVGVVVNVYDNGAAYEVEFLSMDGHTIGLATIDAADLRPITGSAVLHEREQLSVTEQSPLDERLLERLRRFDQEKHGGEFPPRPDGVA